MVGEFSIGAQWAQRNTDFIVLLLMLALPFAAIIYFDSQYELQFERAKKYLIDRPILTFLVLILFVGLAVLVFYFTRKISA